MARRHEELEAMKIFMHTHPVTRCPTAVAVPTQGAHVSPEDLAAIQKHTQRQEARRAKNVQRMMAPSKQRETEKFTGFCVMMAPIIREIQATMPTLTAIAAELNNREIKSFRGAKWFPTNVRTVLDRAEEALVTHEAATP